MSDRPKPDLRNPEYVAYAHLSNDVAAAVPKDRFVDLGTRENIAGHLWRLGYRRTAGSEPATGARSAEPGSVGVPGPSEDGESL